MAQVETTEVGRSRHVSGVLMGALIGYVERVLGPEGVDAVFARAGVDLDDRPRSGGVDWLPIRESERLAEAASIECGDPDIGRRTGEEVFWSHEAAGVDELFRSAGTIEAGLEPLVEFGSRTTSGRSFELLEVGDGFAVIAARSPRTHAWICGIGAGYFALFPTWYGRSGACAEVQCQRNGDDRCVYRLTWTAGESGGVDATHAYREQVTEQFEQLQAVAAELTSAENVDGALRRVIERVGTAALAPRFLLVSNVPGTERRVYHSGFDRPGHAEDAAAQALTGEVAGYGTPLVAHLESGGRRYGALIALFPDGAVPNDSERRALDAYARYATTAVETAQALEQARYDRDATKALLDLAERFAAAGGPDDVAACLLEAVASTTGSDAGRIWLCDDEGVAVDGQAGEVVSLSPADVAWLSAGPAPCLPGARSPAMARAVGRLHGLTAPAHLFPVLARGRLLAILAAAPPPAAETAHAERVTDRLLAIATQAATALDNSRLVAAIRHQATHDSLTGMLNRRAFEDAVAVALTGRRAEDRMATLFIDLDEFKAVNDTLGHAAGDRLLCEVADRIQRSIRPSDLVARLGGDEFAVLLRGVANRADADRAARRLLDAMAEPFTVEGHVLACSFSIGVGVAPDDGITYDRLVGQADEEMYRMKGARKAAPGPSPSTARRSGRRRAPARAPR